ncbi:MAG TPA: hypothetical protein VM033_03365, partial [Gemmatimonadaceae bacterium]|nr:hypothetical protein [Gemmatimonadaceae bacterium]
MPSRAELRRVAEWALRAALVLLLVLALRRATHERPADSQTRRVATSALPRALEDATRDDRLGAIDLAIDGMPSL